MGFSRQEYWSGVPLPSPEKCYRWSYLQRRNRNTDIESNVWVPRASLVAQMVKNLPAMQETWVRSLENPLDKGMASHPSTLDWRISWTEEPGGLQSMGSQTVGWIERLTLSFSRGKGGWKELVDWDWHIYTIDTVYKVDTNENLLYSAGNSPGCSMT